MLGLVRERVFAHYFGIGLEADAFRAALRIPNIIRNLLGEGTLSASFIPVYAGALERGDKEGARRLAGSVLSFLILLAVGACALGIVFAPQLTRVVAYGFDAPTHALATSLSRILFPMAGLLIVAAWSLGVLNTNRRFFLSYAAPTLWNIAQIATLIFFGGMIAGADLMTALAWGALGGTVLHLAVQLPATFKLTGGFSWLLDRNVPGFSRVVKAWIPVIAGAGAMQISSLIDLQLASMLGQGSVANLGYAQLIGILPVSLFGVSMAAASLPELSRDAVSPDPEQLRLRMASAVRRVMYFVLPSAAACVFFGAHIVGIILQTGAFDTEQTMAVALVLAGIGVGLPASSSIKLLASGHYALGDTRTPVRIAMVSVTIGAGLAFVLMQRFNVLGIVLGGSVGAYTNISLNTVFLHKKVGRIVGAPEIRWLVTTVLAVVMATLAGRAIEPLLPEGIWLPALATLGTFGIVYLLATRLAGHPDARVLPQGVGSGVD